MCISDPVGKISFRSKGTYVLVCAVESHQQRHNGGAATVQCYKDPFGHCRSRSLQLSLSLYKNISMLRISVFSPKKLWLKRSLEKQSKEQLVFKEQRVDVKQQCVLTSGKADGMLGCISWSTTVQLKGLALSVCSALVSA